MSNVEELRRTENDLHADVTRAERLAMFMEEFQVQQMLLDYQQQLMAEMVDLPRKDDEARRHLRDAIHTARYVYVRFRDILHQGELSKQSLVEIERKKRFGNIGA